MDVVDTAFAFGRFRLVPSRRQLLVDGQSAALGSRAFDLLLALIERRERIVTKDELLDIVWPDVVVEEANLHVQISALRKVLGPNTIATVPGRGYRFVATLRNEAAMSPAPATAATPSQLPAHTTALIGRDDTLLTLTGLLQTHGLVTLTGPGGIGKTRLALAAANALAQTWSDGVAWVELAVVRDAAQVASAVASALHVALAGPADAVRLASALHGKSMLLVLDNGEHVLDAITVLVQAVRQSSAQVHVLLTSQEALRVANEQVFAVPPLGLPAPHEPADDRFGAVRLFVERARAADRRFVLDAGNALAVADICRRLDGLPLAIELAAARVPLLGVQVLRDRLAQQLDLLTRGARDAVPRHQTLRNALAWSHSLLAPAEQTVLRRLSVFAGGFSLELAQAVAGDPTLDERAVLDALGGLIDKSLVAVDPGEPVRYRLLETMRAFALERLVEAGEQAALQERQARAVADLFDRINDARFGDAGTASEAEATQLSRPEIDNARAALAWSTRAQDQALTARLAGGTAAVFYAAGFAHEILPHLRASLPHLSQAPPSAQVDVLMRLGQLGVLGGIPHEDLQQFKLDAVASARRHGLRRRLQLSLAALGFTLARRGEAAAAQQVIDELNTLAQPNDPVFLRVLALSVPFMLAQQRDDVKAAVQILGQQRALLMGGSDDIALLTTEANLVMYLNVLGRHDEAARLGLALLARPELPRLVLIPCATMYALTSLGRVDEARRVLAQWRCAIAAAPIGAVSGEALAMLCLAAQRLDDAVRIDAAIEARTASGSAPHLLTRAFRARLAAAVQAADVPVADVERWRREGALITDAAAVELALR